MDCAFNILLYLLSLGFCFILCVLFCYFELFFPYKSWDCLCVHSLVVYNSIKDLVEFLVCAQRNALSISHKYERMSFVGVYH